MLSRPLAIITSNLHFTLGFLALFCALIAPSLFVTNAHAASVNSQKVNKFNQAFTKRVNREFHNHNIPGGAFVIVKNNQIIALETFGHTDKSKKQKITPETIFRLASVSKPFAATITTMLAQEQQLQLNEPVTNYVENFSLAQKGAADKIQVKHVLSHTTGLMPNTYDNLLHENWSMDKIVGRFDRLSPICQPEKCYGYQNIAYGFLAPIVEAIQNKSYADIVDERIFQPLAMHNASIGFDVYDSKHPKNANTAKPHILIKRNKLKRKDSQGNSLYKYIWRTVKVTPDYYKVPAAAGVNASITDMSKWLMANLGHNPDVLSAQLLAEMTAPRVKTKRDMRRRYWREHMKDAHYGYGWRIYQLEQHPIVYHSGWVAGFRADIGYSPDLDLGFAMLINAESNVISKLSSKFWQTAHKTFERVESPMRLGQTPMPTELSTASESEVSQKTAKTTASNKTFNQKSAELSQPKLSQVEHRKLTEDSPVAQSIPMNAQEMRAQLKPKSKIKDD